MLDPFQVLLTATKHFRPIRYALGLAALLALIAMARSWGIDLRVAGFASLVFFILLVPLLLFAQLTSAVRGPLRYPCLVMLWASIIVCISCWVVLFTSVFFSWPRNLGHWLIGGEPTTSTVEVSRPASTKPTTPVLPKTETRLEHVVDIHVGGDDSKSSKFVFTAPPGYVIKGYKLLERSKGGDAHYSAAVSTATTLTINWSVHSKTVRGPFKVVLNTITAFLKLDAEIVLQEYTNDA